MREVHQDEQQKNKEGGAKKRRRSSVCKSRASSGESVQALRERARVSPGKKKEKKKRKKSGKGKKKHVQSVTMGTLSTAGGMSARGASRCNACSHLSPMLCVRRKKMRKRSTLESCSKKTLEKRPFGTDYRYINELRVGPAAVAVSLRERAVARPRAIPQR